MPGYTRDPLLDKIQDVKARIGLFIAQYCLPFSMAGPLLALAQILSDDVPALKATRMERTACAYTINHGLAFSVKTELTRKLKGRFVSLNVDEATNHAHDKMLNILCQYFDDERDMFVMELLGSKVVNLASAENLFSAISSTLDEYEIQWDQVISILSDNCNVMRGCKSGVEARIRLENPNLLDISGDTVHMVNNSCQAFFDKIEEFYSVQPVLGRVFYDIQDSPKQKELFQQVQVLMGCKPLSVLRPIPTRFLQMHEVVERTLRLWDCLWMYFYGLLSVDEKKTMAVELDSFLSKYNIDGKLNQLKEIWKQARKNRSGSGQERVDTIALFFFYNSEKSLFFLKLYLGITGQFKAFVKRFQSKKPIAHQLHVEIFSVVRDFLTGFLTPDVISLTSSRELSRLDIESSENHLPLKRLSVGAEAHQSFCVLRKDRVRNNWIDPFLKCLKSAYIAGGKKLMSLPLVNKTLIHLSSFSPDLQRNAETATGLLLLAESLPNVIPPSQLGALDQELRRYTTDFNMSVIEYDTDSDDTRIDTHWYCILFSMTDSAGHPKYPLLTTLAKAALSSFSGPVVEGTFNLMDDILEKDRVNMTQDNFEALLKLKLHMKAKDQDAISYPISLEMRKCIYGASARSKQHSTAKSSASSSSVSVPPSPRLNSSSSTSSGPSSSSTSRPSSTSSGPSSSTSSGPSSSTSSGPSSSTSSGPSSSTSSGPSSETSSASIPRSPTSSGRKRKDVCQQQSIMKFFKR